MDAEGREGLYVHLDQRLFFRAGHIELRREGGAVGGETTALRLVIGDPVRRGAA